MVEKVPPEVLECLFLQVDNPFDLFNLRAACKKWHAIITNERFLNMYFHNRVGAQSRQPLKPTIHRRSLNYSPLPDYNIQYPIPKHLQGSGGVVLHNHLAGRAVFPTLIYPSKHHNYSISMWLRLESYFEKVKVYIRFNDFSLKFTLDPKHARVICPHTGGVQAQACIKVPLHRWFHIVLTYSSKFQFYLNGYAYSLIYTEGPLNENEMPDRQMLIDNDEYFTLTYKGHIKIGSIAKFADIQVLPCALTQYEIRAIIEQITCMAQVNMGRYLLDHWANMHWYSKYLSNCILL